MKGMMARLAGMMKTGKLGSYTKPKSKPKGKK